MAQLHHLILLLEGQDRHLKFTFFFFIQLWLIAINEFNFSHTSSFHRYISSIKLYPIIYIYSDDGSTSRKAPCGLPTRTILCGSNLPISFIELDRLVINNVLILSFNFRFFLLFVHYIHRFLSILFYILFCRSVTMKIVYLYNFWIHTICPYSLIDKPFIRRRFNMVWRIN